MSPFALVFLLMLGGTVLAAIGVPAAVLALIVVSALIIPPLFGMAGIVAEQLKKPPRPRT